MDRYTAETKLWLERRFRQTRKGIYEAHQPVYGFRISPSESGVGARYAITYAIANAINHAQGKTLLDVGGAEGYKAALMAQLFDLQATSCDLSEEACLRARELFGIPATPVDTHHLPYAENAFDIVLSSETLEHVADFQSATKELLRVARNAVIITVPHESEEVVRRNLELGEPHGHLHALSLNSFDFAHEFGVSRIVARPILMSSLRRPFVIAEAPYRTTHGSSIHKKWIYSCWNLIVPILRIISGKWLMTRYLEQDNKFGAQAKEYDGMIFTLIKANDNTSFCRRSDFSARDIIDFHVPRLRLNNGIEATT